MTALLVGATYNKPEHEARWQAERTPFFAHVLDETERRMAAPCEGLHVLDFGCAFGHVLDAVRERGGTAVGIEREAALRDLVAARGHDVVATLGEAPGPFDVALLLDSLYYLHDPVSALAAVREKLRPGGTVVVRVTNRNALVRWVRPDLQGDARLGFSTTALRRALQQAGFDAVDVRPDVGVGKRLPPHRARFYRLGGAASRLVGYRRVFTPGLFAWARVPDPG
ncbi:MAG: class I SAM-dependent methyltransferase [Bacteroidota bacterium]